MSLRDDGDILNAFNEKFRTFDSGNWNSKIEFMNSANFTPPDDDIYIRQFLTFQPARELGVGVGGHYKIYGSYYLNIMIPKGKGMVEAYNLAGGLVSHFQRGTTLTKNSQKVTIERSRYFTVAGDETYVVVQVAVEFYTYVLYNGE